MFQTFFARKIHAWKSDHPKAPGVIPMALFSEPVAICGVILRVLLSNEPRFPYSENVRLNSRPGLRYMIYYFHFGISAQIEWKSWVMENPMPHVCVCESWFIWCLSAFLSTNAASECAPTLTTWQCLAEQRGPWNSPRHVPHRMNTVKKVESRQSRI